MALPITIRKCIVSRNAIFLEPKSLTSLIGNHYATDEGFRRIERPELHYATRGTGYRSSFNGVVCTIFGSSGFIGENLTGRIGRSGTQLVIPYRGEYNAVFPSKVATDLGQILFTPFHLRDEDSIRKAVKYSDVVINLIGKDHDTMNFKLEEVHVEGARRLARICREMGVKKFIHASSMVADPNPREIIVSGGSRFAKTKYAGELAVREEFPDAIIVRLADVYGELDRFFNYYGESVRYVFKTMYLHEKGDNTVKQPVYLRDVVEGFNQLVERPIAEVAGKTYVFAGPRRMYLGAMVDYMCAMMWKDEKYWRFRRGDSRLSVVWNTILHVRNFMFFVEPFSGITVERFEREHLDDKLIEGAPTLETLGIKPTEMSKFILSETRHVRAYAFYYDEVYEFDPPEMPPAADR